jgi:SAM-dependent methyltransferase
MIERAEARLGDDAHRVRFLTRTMDDLEDLGGFDVAVAVNSIVMPDTRKIDQTLRAVRAGLRPDGWFLGVVPSIDAIHYHTMLLMDRALDEGRSPEVAERHAAFHAEHAHYDFAFGRFRFQGLRQKFWQPFELEYRLKKAGFASVVLDQLFYPWDESIIGGEEFADQPKSWDWTFLARPS